MKEKPFFLDPVVQVSYLFKIYLFKYNKWSLIISRKMPTNSWRNHYLGHKGLLYEHMKILSIDNFVVLHARALQRKFLEEICIPLVNCVVSSIMPHTLVRSLGESDVGLVTFLREKQRQQKWERACVANVSKRVLFMARWGVHQSVGRSRGCWSNRVASTPMRRSRI